MRLVAAVALFLLVAGCDATSPFVESSPEDFRGVVLTADQGAYGSGEAILLTLVNGSERTVTMSKLGCARLERWTGHEWEPSREGNDRACLPSRLMLAPGDSVDDEVRVSVTAGSYRLAQWVDGFEVSDTRVATASFRIR